MPGGSSRDLGAALLAVWGPPICELALDTSGLTAAWSGRESGEDAVGEWGAEALREHGSELEEQ